MANNSNQRELFQLTSTSSIDELEQCLIWLRSNFQERKFKIMNIVIKRSPIQNQQTAYQLENYLKSANKSLMQQSDLQNSELSKQFKQEDSTSNLQSTKFATKSESIANQFDGHQMQNSQFDISPQKQLDNKQDLLQQQQASNLYESPITIEQNKKLHQSENNNLHQGNNQEQYAEKDAEQLNNDKNGQIKEEKQKKIEELKVLFQDANDCFKTKNYREAITNFEKCIKLCDEVGNQQTILINSKVYLGSSQMQEKNIDQCIINMEQALVLMKQNNQDVDKMSAAYFFIYNSLGTAYQEKKNINKMIENMELACQNVKEPITNKDTLKQIGHVKNSLGLAYYQMNQNEQAIKNFNESVKIYIELYGKDDISVGNRMNNLGEAYRTSKDYKKALEFFQESLRIKQIHYQNKSDKSIANTLNNIGLTYQNLQKFDDAIEYFKKVLIIYEEIGENQQSLMANLYQSLGECNKSRKDFQEAIHYFGLSYDIKKQFFKTENKASLEIKNAIVTATLYGQLLYQVKQFDQSIKVFEELVYNQKSIYGENTIHVGQTLNNIATVYSEAKMFDKAIESVERALDIFQNVKPPVEPSFVKKVQDNYNNIKQKKEFHLSQQQQ